MPMALTFSSGMESMRSLKGAVAILMFFPVSSSAHLRVLRELLAFEAEGLAFDIAVRTIRASGAPPVTIACSATHG